MHNDTAPDGGELARVEYCGATRERHSCALERGHVGAHAADFAPGQPGVSWVGSVQEEKRAELVAREPWAPHKFPERTRTGKPRYLQRSVKRAREPYPCDSLEPAPGHHSIEPGELYLRVGSPPGKVGSGRPRWRHFRLCADCAIAYELATVERWDP